MSNSKEPICGIYKIENLINGNVYIGQSRDIERRIKCHKSKLANNKHYNEHLQSAVNKYGIDNFSFDIIETCGISELDQKEIDYIKKYDSYKNGYNRTAGGGGIYGFCFSDETIQKLKASHHDVSGFRNPMYGKKMIDVMGEEKYMEYVARTHDARSEAGRKRRGWHMSEVGRRHASEARKKYLSTNPDLTGHIPSEEKRAKISVSNKKRHKENPELYYTKHVVLLNTGEVFKSIREAASKYGVNEEGLSNCVNKKAYSCGKAPCGEKLVWVSEDEFSNMTRDDVSTTLNRAQNRNVGKEKPNARSVRCINTGAIFDTVTSAGNNMHIDISSISKCCRGKIEYAGKDPVTGEHYNWEFV